jgi:hypothetical protein
MAEKKSVRTRNIAFRVTNQEYEQVEKLAAEAGLDPNTWCYKVLVDALQEGSGLSRNERILYGEIARLRYLVGHGFKLILGGEQPTAAAWKKITTQVEERGEEIVAGLLARRK